MWKKKQKKKKNKKKKKKIIPKLFATPDPTQTARTIDDNLCNEDNEMEKITFFSCYRSKQ